MPTHTKSAATTRNHTPKNEKPKGDRSIESHAAVVFRAGKAGQVEQIDSSLDGLQALVGGWIECFPLGGSLWAYCNEEGLLKELDPCVYVKPMDWVLVGTVLVVASTRDGTIRSLTPAETEMVKSLVVPVSILVAPGKGGK